MTPFFSKLPFPNEAPCFGCDQLRTPHGTCALEKQSLSFSFLTASCCFYLREVVEQCSVSSFSRSVLPHSVAGRCRAMEKFFMLGLVPFALFGFVPTMVPPASIENTGAMGRGLSSEVSFVPGSSFPCWTRIATTRNIGARALLLPQATAFPVRFRVAWSRCNLALTTRVYGANMHSFKAFRVRIRGTGTVFLESSRC